MDGREQRRIQTGQASEYLGVGAVALARVVIDCSELAGVGDQNIITVNKWLAQREWAPTSIAILQG